MFTGLLIITEVDWKTSRLFTYYVLLVALSDNEATCPMADWSGGKIQFAFVLPMRGPVTEQFLALLSQKTADDGDGVIALLEDKPARN